VVHQGCTRNEYHEYDIEEHQPGGRACLFFNLGCQGPLTRAVCNSDLWNGVSSKTRAGVPCFGCTSPDFPRDNDLFRTEKIGEVPLRLPLGVERPRYMAYKNLARAAAPQRVRDKEMEP
jgi:hydrogenase small subunit